MVAPVFTLKAAGAVFITYKSHLAGLLSIIVATAFITRLLNRWDDREPPLLQPRIPFIGHLIGILRHRTNFLVRLSKQGMPIASLPILGSTTYAIWDASLIQAAYRNKSLSFIPFVTEFARRELGYDKAGDKMVNETNFMPEFFKAIHKGMATQHLHQMNINALQYIENRFNEIRCQKEDLIIPNFYLYIRDLITMSTTEALYGRNNPARSFPTFIDDLWIFEEELTLLLLNIFPSIIAKKPFYARKRLQKALGHYYASSGDQSQDTACITRNRAEVLRRFGIQGAQIGVYELSLVHAATTSIGPTFFWFIAHIVTRPNLVEQLRTEALTAIQQGLDDEILVNVDALFYNCPLLASSFRESVRLSNKTIGVRKVMEDTSITDSTDRAYLLKKGATVQMPSGVLHNLGHVWGEDADVFNASRFIEDGKGVGSGVTKARHSSYVPFGGGQHLCPGRHFAVAQSLACALSMILAFDISPIDDNWELFKPPPMQQCFMSAAVCKPEIQGDGLGVRIKSRQGWEMKKWKYVSGKAETNL